MEWIKYKPQIMIDIMKNPKYFAKMKKANTLEKSIELVKEYCNEYNINYESIVVK